MDGTRSLVTNGELILYGIIDPDDPSGIRAIDVIDSLAQLSNMKTITARINSPGGSVVEGLAIYNALRASGKPVTTQVDSMAASAASIVALAGDDIVMAQNATIMIHDPWAIAMGSSDDLRKSADEIDRQKAIIVALYANRTGLDPADITAMMAAETYMSATQAIEKGFATRIEQLPAVAAMEKLDGPRMAKLLLAKTSIPDSIRASAARAANTQRPTMKTPAESGAGGGDPAVVVNPVVPPQAPDLTVVRAEAAKAERERIGAISQAVRAAKLDNSVADELIRSGATVEAARTTVLEKWTEAMAKSEGFGTAIETRNQIKVIADGVDKWAEGAEAGLMMRAGLIKADPKNEFRGLTLAELARSSLDVRNIKTGAVNRMDMVGRAFTVRNEGAGFNSTSDFPNILQNVAYKAMMKGYTEVEETFDQWTSKGTLTDFRPAFRVDSGLFPSLDKIDEGAEYKQGTVTDSGTMVVLATYGKLFAITRQAIVNDDLHYFNRIPLKMGRAAKRTIGNLVYAILNTNPTMQDSVALFNSAHGNLAASGGAPTAVTISAARTAMARQKDDAGIATGVGIKPKYILLPPELIDSTNTVLKAEYLTSDAGLQPNYVQNAATPVSDGRLSGTSWFLAADPAMTDTIEVDYLDGVEEPFMDQKMGWTVDGAEYKVRIDAGVKALHWRGLYKNPGA